MKQKTVYVCQVCGASFPKWLGKCSSCGEWNSLVEEAVEVTKAGTTKKPSTTSKKATPISRVDINPINRIKTGISELDEVTGGGIVPGSLVLLGGEPGIGKSTILLQTALAISATGKRVLYSSGEESAAQVKLRGERLDNLNDNLLILAENNVDDIILVAKQEEVDILIVDSIQTVYTEECTSTTGSVSQVRNCGGILMNYAKGNNVAVILVGHVTKEGTLAGPRVLEHLVDTVLYFEGERHGALRLLRSIKNRFGSTNEIGVFEMASNGLISKPNPSGIFLSERKGEVAGSAIGCAMQGTRPLLLEIQALTSPTSFGNPRRLGTGIEYNRLLMIIAVLEKKLGLKLGMQDIYVSIAGGIRVDDPALDLPIAAAIVSAYKNEPLEKDIVLAGEIGLTGEIRKSPHSDRRIKEAAKFGFNKILLPYSTTKETGDLQIIYATNLLRSLTATGLL